MNWKRVEKAADRLGPSHVAELMAVKQASFVSDESRCPTTRLYDPDGRDLVRWKLLSAVAVEGWSKRTHWLLHLTELGERVLLRIAEDALLATGMMKLDPTEDEG